MDLCNEFQNYADECARIAATSSDPNARAAWQGLAERWGQIAQTQLEAERQAQKMQNSRLPRRRRSQHRWSHAFAQSCLP
jgi:ferric-dicitrate binding protein FerR (iron transport regulator)